MSKVRPYLPLLGFVVPTVVLGYGVVIPGSCIAGVNELTVGFGTTILGAIFTYLAGQRAVKRCPACAEPPHLSRVARAINRQAASPHGLLGRLLGGYWRREHLHLNREVVARLGVHPGHRVLEIGSGPGDALDEAARRARGGKVIGIDASSLMVRLARERNLDAVLRGAVEVRLGDARSLTLEGETFDRIFSVHCIYFWDDLDGVLVHLVAALSRDGKLVLAFRPEGDAIPVRFRDPTYRFRHTDEVESAMRRAGLAEVNCERSATMPEVVLVVARRPAAASLSTPAGER
jgi:SAM-dependent methyltransferase